LIIKAIVKVESMDEQKASPLLDIPKDRPQHGGDDGFHFPKR
jgi:hypothetical protein